MIFESHAHYDDAAFDEDRDKLLSAMEAGGVGRIVNIASGIPSCKTTLALAQKYEQIYAALGVHPEEAEGLNEETFAWLEQRLAEEKVVAVGEIGLDYYWPEPGRELQQKWFREQLRLAGRAGLPVVIHSRDAFADTLRIMQEEHAEKIGGVVHCYSYTKENVPDFLQMGYYFGIGGVVTFKNGKKLKEAVAKIPLERILLETDCPYLAPEPNRGKRNSSLNLPYVVTAIAAIKEVSEEEVLRATWENACNLFGMTK